MADPNLARLFTASAVVPWFGIVLRSFGVIVLAVIGPAPRGSDYEETRAKKRMENLKASRDDATKALTTYGWIDKNKGVARIPITRAMELTVAQLAQQKPAPAGPIATPEPQAPAAPASPGPAVSPQPGAAQPSASHPAQAPASPPPQAGQSPPGSPLPAPAKTP